MLTITICTLTFTCIARSPYCYHSNCNLHVALGAVAHVGERLQSHPLHWYRNLHTKTCHMIVIETDMFSQKYSNHQREDKAKPWRHISISNVCDNNINKIPANENVTHNSNRNKRVHPKRLKPSQLRKR